jgi:hypothetical protein
VLNHKKYLGGTFLQFLFLLTQLFSHRVLAVIPTTFLICADERSVVYFLLCAALLKIPLRMLGGLLIVLYSSSDVAVFILLTSLLTFLVSLSLSSTFALTYLLTSGFISGIIVIFKSLVVVMQINFTLALSFAAAQYIFVSVFTPSGAINLLVQLPTKLILLTLIFLHSNAVIPTLLSLLFLSLATFATSMRILFLLGSTAQVPSLLNLFFDLPDVTAINFFCGTVRSSF